MLFYQATAPLGWTKQTTQNDKALRVVSGSTGGSSGGTNSFSSVMAQTVVGNHTLTAAELAPHNSGGANSIVGYPNGNSGYYFPMTPNGGWSAGGGGGGSGANAQAQNGSITYSSACSASNNITTTSQGTTGTAHNHSIQMAMAYIDVIIASKN